MTTTNGLPEEKKPWRWPWISRKLHKERVNNLLIHNKSLIDRVHNAEGNLHKLRKSYDALKRQLGELDYLRNRVAQYEIESQQDQSPVSVPPKGK